ncbi:hypothetical protein [Herpetosiphon geysericola]|uniref:Uncharacterized protein n=1 Tax=Herpetosiphon geysericola TaxID=70996 RepID=A0A0P6Y776_9CHLR|nr:hypothetical protein [Herpetosiphon geysericola]KPL85577.1 hypothetical protein SE18_18375 [Herpetosiphon geysericola]
MWLRLSSSVIQIILLLLIISGCTASNPTSQPTVGLVFPQVRPKSIGQVPQAIASGELIIRGNCLRLEPANNQVSYLIIWNDQFRLEKTTISDLKTAQQVVGGSEVRLGGGEVQPEFFTHLMAPLNNACSGPYWFATEINPN